MSDIVRALTNG